MVEHPDLTGRLAGDTAGEPSETSHRTGDPAEVEDHGHDATDDEPVDHEDQVPHSGEGAGPGELIPRLSAERNEAMLALDGHRVRLTNLRKVFLPHQAITKGALIQYYLDMAPVLLPHLRHRAIVMKRYPNGISGKFFFMKRAPVPRPKWISTCRVVHEPGAIDFPMVDGHASLAWLVNLGCIDLHPWYARCDDTDRPDYLHFDLDPGDASFEHVRQVALLLHETLDRMSIPNLAKTSGSRGIHVYVPVERGPTQKDVWTVAKALARELAERHPKLVTAEYRVANRPSGRVLIDYNQNAWGRTLASVYSVRPVPRALVSMPVTWEEIQDGIVLEAFRIENAPARVKRTGDLWAPLLPGAPHRFDLHRFFKQVA